MDVEYLTEQFEIQEEISTADNQQLNKNKNFIYNIIRNIF